MYQISALTISCNVIQMITDYSPEHLIFLTLYKCTTVGQTNSFIDINFIFIVLVTHKKGKI